MGHYQLPWLLYLKYDHHEQRMTIHLSDHMKNKVDAEDAIINFQLDEIAECIHKYDYRKLKFFSEEMPSDSTFDTLIRFKFNELKQPIKTHAICQKTSKGFECIHVAEMDLLKTKNILRFEKFDDLKKKICWNEEDNLKMLITKNMAKYRSHLYEVIQR